MRALFLAAALAVCAPGAAWPQTEPAPAASPVPAELPAPSGLNTDPADAPAGAYALDPRHASVLWRVRHTAAGVYVGRFDTTAGTINFDPAAPENSTLDVTVQAGSVSTGLVNDRGERAFDGEIANLLGAADHPDIHFVSRSVTRTGPATGLIEGDLTLNGQTHPATFEATFHGGRFVQLRGKHVLAFSARTIIDRKQWDVGSLIFNRFAGDEVEILIEAEFVKA